MNGPTVYVRMELMLIVGTDDVIRQHRYCDHYVKRHVCVYASMIKQNPLIRMN